jgi:hypothetical protein
MTYKMSNYFNITYCPPRNPTDTIFNANNFIYNCSTMRTSGPTGPQGMTGSSGATGPQGATGSSISQNIGGRSDVLTFTSGNATSAHGFSFTPTWLVACCGDYAASPTLRTIYAGGFDATNVTFVAITTGNVVFNGVARINWVAGR